MVTVALPHNTLDREEKNKTKIHLIKIKIKSNFGFVTIFLVTHIQFHIKEMYFVIKKYKNIYLYICSISIGQGWTKKNARNHINQVYNFIIQTPWFTNHILVKSLQIHCMNRRFHTLSYI